MVVVVVVVVVVVAVVAVVAAVVVVVAVAVAVAVAVVVVVVVAVAVAVAVAAVVVVVIVVVAVAVAVAVAAPVCKSKRPTDCEFGVLQATADARYMMRNSQIKIQTCPNASSLTETPAESLNSALNRWFNYTLKQHTLPKLYNKSNPEGLAPKACNPPHPNRMPKKLRSWRAHCDLATSRLVDLGVQDARFSGLVLQCLGQLAGAVVKITRVGYLKSWGQRV